MPILLPESMKLGCNLEMLMSIGRCYQRPLVTSSVCARSSAGKI